MNIKMRFKTLIAMLALVTLTYAQEGNPTMHLTLDKAIELALSENPTMKVAEQEIQLKEVSKREAWQNLLPTVSIDGTISYNIKVAEIKTSMGSFKMGMDDSNTWNGALQVAVPLYAPAVYKTMSLTKSDLELAVEKSRGSKLDLVNQVTKAYYQLMLAQDSYKVLQDNYKQAEINFDIVKAKFDQGSVSEYDKLSAEVQKNSAWPSVVSGKNAVELAKLQLKVLMGITADVNLVIDDNLKNHEVEMAAAGTQRIDLSNNSTLRQLDLNADLLRKQRKILNTSFHPTLALVGSYQYQSMSNTNWEVHNYNWSNASSLTLSLSIPLFKASNFTKLKTNKIQQSQLAENRLNTERMLNMQAQSYIDNMKKSTEQLQSSKLAVEQAQKGLNISQKRYEVGKGTILELNNSQVSLTNTQLAYNNTIFEYLVAQSELNTVLGKE
ncbi:MAG: TolC family protein [Bacteroidaceae bacterium]|nr:TolC family protein [Bacteroidaceae bacterium]MBP3613637.1 TolC family protein [Bacteroidaceae bacterium]